MVAMNIRKSYGFFATLLLAFTHCASAATTVLFSSPSCGVQFQVPRNHTVTRITTAGMTPGRCAFVVGTSSDTEVIVGIFDSSFVSVAHENGFRTLGESRDEYGDNFTGNDDDWLIVGRQGAASRADVEIVNGMRIVSGVAAVGRSVDGGGMAMGEETRALVELSPGVVVVVSGDLRENVFRLLSTLRTIASERRTSPN